LYISLQGNSIRDVQHAGHLEHGGHVLLVLQVAEAPHGFGRHLFRPGDLQDRSAVSARSVPSGPRSARPPARRPRSSEWWRRAPRHVIHGRAHHVQVIGTDVGDHPDGGVHDALLGHRCRSGRTAMHSMTMAWPFPPRPVEDADLLADVRAAHAHHRFFGGVGRMSRAFDPVTLATVRIPASLSAAPIRRVTEDFPRLPLTWIRIGMARKARRRRSASRTREW